jgi:hypothetical protein
MEGATGQHTTTRVSPLDAARYHGAHTWLRWPGWAPHHMGLRGRPQQPGSAWWPCAQDTAVSSCAQRPATHATAGVRSAAPVQWPQLTAVEGTPHTLCSVHSYHPNRYAGTYLQLQGDQGPLHVQAQHRAATKQWPACVVTV